MATNNPPREPAKSFHRAIFFCCTASRRFLNPVFSLGLKTVTSEMIIRPEPNEIRAACNPLSNWCDNSPFIRACMEIIAPAIAARISSRIIYERHQTFVYQQSNPSKQKEIDR